MSGFPFRERLEARLAAANLAVTAAKIAQLDQYFQILLRWNRTINLTGLELDPLSDQAIDRLFCEPIAAVLHFPSTARSWVDIGSGGGSPAFPVKIAIPALPVTLVEIRDRKCAFLREAARDLKLLRTSVVNQRFEEAAAWMDRADLITLRAVRAHPQLSQAIAHVLEDHGLVLVFGEVSALDWPHFAAEPKVSELLRSNRSVLSILKKA